MYLILKKIIIQYLYNQNYKHNFIIIIIKKLELNILIKCAIFVHFI